VSHRFPVVSVRVMYNVSFFIRRRCSYLPGSTPILYYEVPLLTMFKETVVSLFVLRTKETHNYTLRTKCHVHKFHIPRYKAVWYIEVNRHFRWICRLHLQGLRLYQAGNLCEAGRKYFLDLNFNSEDGGNVFLRNFGRLPTSFQLWRWRQRVPPKCWSTSNELHGFIS
jgi:hypothetical protein